MNRLKGTNNLGDILAQTLYLEQIRVNENRWKADPVDEKDFWLQIKKKVINANIPVSDAKKSSTPEQEKILDEIIDRYANEIAGRFEISSHRFAQRMVPMIFRRVLNSSGLTDIRGLFRKREYIRDYIHLDGEIDKIRELAKHGTLIMLPTHFSNLDSIVVGWAINAIGLPACLYGAGLNLFSIRVLSYFMNRLGAYKVDRRKKNRIYLETLKAYSSMAIERGTHSLFFPGGTRSRSGSLESKLKLGLIGTAFDAQYNLVKKGSDKKIFAVPVILNYHVVLEAPGLIDQHLRKEGKEFYMVENDEFSTSVNFVKFLYKFLTRKSEINITFGQPMDMFGNRVDEKGNSLDKDGRHIDVRDYFMVNGSINKDTQREAVYTNILAEKIVEAYHRDNTVLSSHLIAFAAFEIFKKQNRNIDLYSLLRLPKEDAVINFEIFKSRVDILRNHLIIMASKGKLKLSKQVELSTEETIQHGLRRLGVFHADKILALNKQGNLFTENMKVLYFYHNRLEGYELSQIL